MGSCHLCSYVGSGHPVFDEIMSYVTDNVHRVHINELAAHVKTALLQQLQIDMTQCTRRSRSVTTSWHTSASRR